jgi:hypothetical protein
MQTYQAIIRVRSNDTEATYVRYVIMRYMQNEEREWVLAGTQATMQNEWTAIPLAGVSLDTVESAFANSLRGYRPPPPEPLPPIDESISPFAQHLQHRDLLQLSAETYESASIARQNTNLDARMDIVIADIVIGSEILIAHGQVELEFEFDGGWNLTDFSIYTPFETSVRPDKDFTLTEDQLITEFLNLDTFHDGTTIERNDISNVNILGYGSYNMGKTRNYIGSLTVQKGIITYAFEYIFEFAYTDGAGWSVNERGHSFSTFSIEFVDLLDTIWVGSWNPDFREQTQLAIHITEVSADYELKAIVMAAYPVLAQISTGKIVTDEWSPIMELELNFFEWVSDPNYFHHSLMGQTSGEVNLHSGRLGRDGVSITYPGRIFAGFPIWNYELTLSDAMPNWDYSVSGD